MPLLGKEDKDMGGRGSSLGGGVSYNQLSQTERTQVRQRVTTADERNRQELARVQRENRTNSALAAQDLQRGQSYNIQWTRNEVRTGTYIGSQMVNGIAVSRFRGSDGRVMVIDNDDIRRTVSRRR